MLIQYNTVKPYLKGSAVLLRFKKKAKIKKNPDWIYLSVNPIGFGSVNPIDSV